MDMEILILILIASLIFALVVVVFRLNMNTTDRFRWFGWVLWTAVVVAALVGWLWLERDPTTLAPVLGWVTGAVGIGEASNVGKRATWKQGAADMDVAAEERTRAGEAGFGQRGQAKND